jgi:hypothetical protein
VAVVIPDGPVIWSRPDWSEALWDLDELTATAAHRYGARSQAIWFLLTDELLRVRRHLVEAPGAAVPTARVARLRRTIQDLFDLGGYLQAGPAPNARPVPGEPGLIEYDREVFDTRYLTAVPTVQADLVTMRDGRLDGLTPGAHHMFVVDDAGRLIVWRRPFRMDDLVFGRNRATVDGVPVAHPMLVADRLRVRAAGEVVFLAGADLVARAAVVNTKSGHFRPPPSCLGAIRTAFAAAAGLEPEALDVFTMGEQVPG